MIKPLNKIAAALAGAILVMLSAVSPAAAGPIKAQATINGCDPNNVCLYDWTGTNYASGFWQRTFTQIANSNDGAPDCINLSNHQWHDLNGSPNNTASSLIINMASGTSPKKITFYDSASCGGTYYYGYFVSTGGTRIESNMATTSRPDCNFGYCSINWYDRVSSVSVSNA